MVSTPSVPPGETEFDKVTRSTQLLKAFTPHQPISLPEFLSGRVDLLYRVQDSVHTEGLHVVLYGDRGTGKTSLAKVVSYLVQEPDVEFGRRCVLVSCTAQDTFSTIWRKVGQEVLLSQRQLGFAQQQTLQIIGRLDVDHQVTSPSDARIMLEALSHPTVVVFDEFDRITDRQTQGLMADTIKYFSDYNVRTTLICVGVGKSLSDLLHEHLSISRNIAQVRVNPMGLDELAQIIQKGCKYSDLEFEEGIDTEIAYLSQGYPHYTHLLGLWAGRKAFQQSRTQLTMADLNNAIPDVLENAEGGLQGQYERAVDSTKKTALFKQVLLACALANKDSLGRFPVGALQEPLKLITGQNYTTGAYQAHLGKFCEEERGMVLERSGQPKSYRWRFLNPQLIPYIVLQGVNQKLIQPSLLPTLTQP